MSSTVLWDDSLAPATSSLGFLQASREHVAEALRQWRERLHGSAHRVHLEGGLAENIRALEPLTSGARPRELVVATRNPEWTAIFDCGVSGSDPFSTIAVLARTMHVRGVAITSIPDRRAGHGGIDRFGARQLELFGPVGTPSLNSLRAISLIRDGRRWRFDLVGDPQEFEDLGAYQRRKIVDRFTEQMLIDYAAALGLEPFNEDFYAGPCELVTNASAPAPGSLLRSIEEARRYYGIDPG